jgi:pimeloyl-ACP methyl ester carboxylesterase
MILNTVNMIHPRDWHKAGKYFTYNHQQVFYREEGKGEVLLCVHGFPTSSWDWQAIWAEVISRYKVIAPDMLGFGFSDKPRKYKYSIHDQAELHEQLLKKLGIHSVHLLAHDYGDTVAQELLARHNEREAKGDNSLIIKSLVLLNGGIFPEMHRARPIQKLLESPIGFVVAKAYGEDKFRDSFSSVFGSESKPSLEELKHFWSMMHYQKGNLILHKLIHYMADRRKYRDRWVNALIETHIPLRLINGPEDPVSGRHAAERYQELIPNPDVVLLDKIGHYPQTEDPQGVLKAYLEFREKLKTK